MMRVVVLPLDVVKAKQILDWCATTFGPAHAKGPWSYSSSYNQLKLMGSERMMMYTLRWE